MSLYNMLITTHPLAGYLLHHLNLKPDQVARLRDVVLVKEGDEYRVRVLTRTGGNNRETYKESNNRLKAHPLYISDTDEWDPTYASFDFKLPEPVITEFKEEGISLDDFVDVLSFKEKFDSVLEGLKEEASKKAKG